MWTVYIHTNKENGKVYIGITGQPVERRWRSDGSGYKKCLLFYRAIQKYGWDSFEHKILHEVKTKEEAEALEKKLIKEYKSNNVEFGYNIANGGSVHHISEQTKKKISQTLKENYVKENHPNYGNKYSDEMKKKLSQSHIGLQAKENHYMYGKHHSDDMKERIRNTNISKGIMPSIEARKKGAAARSKAVMQFDSEWNYINKFASAASASKETGINKCMIGQSCRSNGNKIVSGYIWQFAQEVGA